MEARLVDLIPAGPGWQYEPKWDGFRCLAFRDGEGIELQSKSRQPLARYFPEVVEHLRSLAARAFVLDGEIVVPVDGRLSFDDLLQRIHPAASRIERLARERPAVLIVFDLLVDASGHSLVARPLRERRRLLEAFAARQFGGRDDIRLSPATPDAGQARAWLDLAGGTLDGIVAKRLDLPYQSGERTGMQKVKRRRTADCVVGGFRFAAGSRVVGSLLLGLYDGDGLLHHVGFTAGFPAATRKALLAKLEPLIAPPGFTGRAPGGPSRWSTERSGEWQPLAPRLVVEVSYDHFTGDRFRHATRFLRWRPDKAPRQCTLDQVAPSSRDPGLPGSASAPRRGSGAGSPRRAPSTSRRSSAGSRRRAGRG
ncbi:MAG TPA: ATP-dependent DNA ligase [Methylomirabilota bacterium]|nr:ATP-dependent DNA ligase [Methylomirabilota bacterium]